MRAEKSNPMQRVTKHLVSSIRIFGDAALGRRPEIYYGAYSYIHNFCIPALSVRSGFLADDQRKEIYTAAYSCLMALVDRVDFLSVPLMVRLMTPIAPDQRATGCS